jgi:hypothetical protein
MQEMLPKLSLQDILAAIEHIERKLEGIPFCCAVNVASITIFSFCRETTPGVRSEIDRQIASLFEVFPFVAQIPQAAGTGQSTGGMRVNPSAQRGGLAGISTPTLK